MWFKKITHYLYEKGGWFFDPLFWSWRSPIDVAIIICIIGIMVVIILRRILN